MMKFEILCFKSRTGRKLSAIPDDFRLLALDPGETTGHCVFEQFKLRVHGQTPTDDIGLGMQDYMDLVEEYEPHIIVCEDYRVYSTHLSQHEFSELLTPKLVGVAEAIAAQKKIPFVKQMAGRAKAFVTDDKLQSWNFYIAGQKHARDAIRHACFWLAFGELQDGPSTNVKRAEGKDPQG